MKNGKISGLGPIAKFFSDNALKKLSNLCNSKDGDSIFFICDQTKEAEKYSGLARIKIANELNLIEKNVFKFCWITDFPIYQYDEEN